MDWKDTLLPGSSRIPIPWKPGDALLPGYVLDQYGQDVQRNDWVAGPGGVPVISGSSEQQGGPMTPSPGFFPVDPIGSYGGRAKDPAWTQYLASEGDLGKALLLYQQTRQVSPLLKQLGLVA